MKIIYHIDMDGKNKNEDTTINTPFELNAIFDAKMKEYTDNLTKILKDRKDISRQAIENKYGIYNLNRHGILVKGNPWAQGKKPNLEIILKIAFAFDIPLSKIFTSESDKIVPIRQNEKIISKVLADFFQNIAEAESSGQDLILLIEEINREIKLGKSSDGNQNSSLYKEIKIKKNA